MPITWKQQQQQHNDVSCKCSRTVAERRDGAAASTRRTLHFGMHCMRRAETSLSRARLIRAETLWISKCHGCRWLFSRLSIAVRLRAYARRCFSCIKAFVMYYVESMRLPQKASSISVTAHLEKWLIVHATYVVNLAWISYECCRKIIVNAEKRESTKKTKGNTNNRMRWDDSIFKRDRFLPSKKINSFMYRNTILLAYEKLF